MCNRKTFTPLCDVVNKSSEPLKMASGKALKWIQEPWASPLKLKEFAEMENPLLVVNQSQIFSFMSEG